MSKLIYKLYLMKPNLAAISMPKEEQDASLPVSATPASTLVDTILLSDLRPRPVRSGGG
jgi:hypothetical protein